MIASVFPLQSSALAWAIVASYFKQIALTSSSLSVKWSSLVSFLSRKISLSSSFASKRIAGRRFDFLPPLVVALTAAADVAAFDPVDEAVVLAAFL